MTRIGTITAPSGLNIQIHEFKTARALAACGMNIEFIVPIDESHIKSPDILIDGVAWEMKAPKGSTVKTVERNVRKAVSQSPNVVFDSLRMKSIPDHAIERELRACANGRIKKLEKLLFVNRRREVIDIK